MSLAALNHPGLVAAAGAGALVCLPLAQDLVAGGAFSWAQIKGAASAAYLIQVIAVSIPGRIDGEVAKAIVEDDTGTSGPGSEAASTEGKNLSPVSGRTLVAPSGWAFAIWGPIFLGEFVYVASQAFVPASDPLVPLLKETAVPFAFAHVFQTLWCAAFRKRYTGNLMYISFGLLSATAFSLSQAHSAYTSGSSTYRYSAGTYAQLFLPITMHCGWTVAASLVNLNGAFSMKESASPKAIALLGHVSVVAAAALGVVVTTARNAPVFGGVITWALLAVADGMKQRIAKAKKDDRLDASNLVGAETQWNLCRIGAAASGAAVIVTTANIFLSRKAK